MSFLFGGGGRKRPNAVFRDAERMLSRSESDLKRNIDGLARQERTKNAEIRRALLANQPATAVRLAQEVVHMRRQIDQLHRTMTLIGQNRLMILRQKSEVALVETLRSTTLALRKCNRMVNVGHMQAIMMQFERDRDALDMKQEMISEFTEELLDSDADAPDDDRESAHDLIEKMRSEIGLEVGEQMSHAVAPISGGISLPGLTGPMERVAVRSAAAMAGEAELHGPSTQSSGISGNAPAPVGEPGLNDVEKDMLARLDRLKRP